MYNAEHLIASQGIQHHSKILINRCVTCHLNAVRPLLMQFFAFSFLFFRLWWKKMEKLVLMLKKWFRPANGVRSTHLLVKINNILLLLFHLKIRNIEFKETHKKFWGGYLACCISLLAFIIVVRKCDRNFDFSWTLRCVFTTRTTWKLHTYVTMGKWYFSITCLV